ncbi:S1C family serine protease [Nitrosomonas sp. Nm132]|uniref:S1C family serine protease n=1 Tax=Nitrosomonas sp. Nm132 TaxID=1881053 RepID=UPI000885493E|nr:trypsin-like peptidase domain-containing protein [Nitrosomonas sp. Nm132]SDH48060.1 serine protease, S1-C subfamily, contains C-terminal PDZ domain [Nitrosomonas sp. Nm132]
MYPSPPASPDPFLRRLMMFTGAVAALILLWWSLPLIESLFTPHEGGVRTVTARGDLAADERTTIELFEKSRDSVVFISTATLVRDIWTRNVFSVPRGTGSGFVWDDAGHVVTNFHVIEDASEAMVKLADGRDYKAALVGVSPAHDIAVLKIGVGFKRPPPVPIGTSHDLKVGQKVFAIGNPFGLDWTLTTGIVSALDRALTSESGRSTIEHLIQTDAAINPGNSGGPLLDSAGRLIGINTAIYSPSGTSAGIGFAVPVDTVMRVVPQLIDKGRYIRPSLGIEVDERLNERIMAMLGIEGVVVLRISPGSAADRAGLKAAILTRDGRIIPNDVIVAVQGKSIHSVSKLFARIDDFKVGDTVRLSVMRDGQTQEIEVVLQPGCMNFALTSRRFAETNCNPG